MFIHSFYGKKCNDNIIIENQVSIVRPTVQVNKSTFSFVSLSHTLFLLHPFLHPSLLPTSTFSLFFPPASSLVAYSIPFARPFPISYFHLSLITSPVIHSLPLFLSSCLFLLIHLSSNIATLLCI